MIRLTWLQFRVQALIAVVAMAITALVLAVTGARLAHLYSTSVATCTVQGDCDTATNAFRLHDQFLQNMLGPLLLVVPGLIGIFWGAPLIAREVQAGTFRLAWTQSVSRRRWLAVKLGSLGLASAIVAGLLSLIVTWWFSPLDRVNANRFSPGVFDERGIVIIGYAVFAFVLGVTAGVLLRRTLPAMAMSLALFVGVRLAVTYLIRPHLVSPAHTSVPVTSATGLGFGSSGSSGVVTFIAKTPRIPNAWVISSQIVEKSGHLASTAVLHQFLMTACPDIANQQAGANQGTFGACVAKVSANYHLVLAYQPANRYWTFQWYETAIFVFLAFALAGLCFWWVSNRLT